MNEKESQLNGNRKREDGHLLCQLHLKISEESQKKGVFADADEYLTGNSALALLRRRSFAPLQCTHTRPLYFRNKQVLSSPSLVNPSLAHSLHLSHYSRASAGRGLVRIFI